MSGERRCRSCRGPLSRYNSTSVCAGCAKNGTTAPRVPTWLWDSETFRRALAEVDLGAALAIMRSAVGLSQLELATLLGWSQSGVARIESGQRDTLYDIRRLFEVVDALHMPRAALIPMLGASDNEPSEREEADEMSLNRRELGGAVIGLAAAAGLGQLQVPAKVDSAHVRHFQASAEKLYAKDQHVGGGALVGGGLQLYYRARRMLDEADYSEATARQLMSAAGELAICVGWLCYDANDSSMARGLYSEARLLADQSGDDGLAVHAMEKMSLQLVRPAQEETRPGHAREAVRLSRRAAELARSDPSPQLHALLAAREAIAHAAVGDGGSFRLAIARAWREIDCASGEGAPVWLEFVNRSEIAVHEAKGHLYLGDPGSAAGLYRTSLEAQLSPRNGAIYRAELAATLAAIGDVTGAVAEGMTVLPALDGGQIASPRTVSELRVVRQAAAQHRSGDEFCARYDQMAGVSA